VNVVSPDQAEGDVQCSGAAIAPFEPRRQRLEQPRQDERQRLGPFNGPLQLDRRLKTLVRTQRHQWSDVLPVREGVPHQPLLSKTRRQLVGWQRRQIAERFQSPPFEYPDDIQRRDR